NACRLDLANALRTLPGEHAGKSEAGATEKRGKRNETSSIYQGRRFGSRSECDCRAGGCSIDAGSQMANDLQLAEIARDAVWRLRNHGQKRGRGDRQQVSDSGFCGG